MILSTEPYLSAFGRDRASDDGGDESASTTEARSYDRCMVDIETLGTEPGCAVVEIAAARFDKTGCGATETWSVSPASNKEAGLSVDPETVAWWLDQSDTLHSQVTGGQPLAVVLEELAGFYDGCREVWAKSPLFDVAILNAAYDAVGGPTPSWHYSETRDVRTVAALPGIIAAPPMDEDDAVEGQAHEALADVQHQVRQVVCGLRLLEQFVDRIDHSLRMHTAVVPE